MTLKKTYALYGSSETGKSSTIKKVFEKLKSKYQEFEILDNVHPIYNEDILVILKIDHIVIAIESQGDPKSRLFESLPLFVEIKADIIICATRTKGSTVELVEKQKNKYEIIWIKKKKTTTTNYDSDNDLVAEEILTKISKDLEAHQIKSKELDV